MAEAESGFMDLVTYKNLFSPFAYAAGRHDGLDSHQRLKSRRLAVSMSLWVETAPHTRKPERRKIIIDLVCRIKRPVQGTTLLAIRQGSWKTRPREL